jgi:hypothetical protein
VSTLTLFQVATAKHVNVEALKAGREYDFNEGLKFYSEEARNRVIRFFRQ